jgi:hypothetical protein
VGGLGGGRGGWGVDATPPRTGTREGRKVKGGGLRDKRCQLGRDVAVT